MDSHSFETDVLIVGSGPTGSTAALALATYGVRTHVVSRWNWLADTPRAHITNQRTVEVFRDLGIEEECARASAPWKLMGDTLFTTSLAGEELLRLRTWGSGEERKGDYRKGSPCPMLDLIQPDLEPILLKNAAARGASYTFNTEYLSHVQDDDGVTTTVRDVLQDRIYTIRSKYLIGADGARSRIVDELGLAIEGEMARAGTAYVIFKADLAHLVAHRPSILHWIVSPAAAFGEIGLGLLRAVRPWNEWIAGWGFDISKGEPDLSEATLRENVRALVGDDSIEFEIVRSSVWYVNQAYATAYSRGRVFCGGDAVHRHPPSSGLGLNTCVQDSFNLAWKLAFVLKGYAGPALLESYSDERAPVGKQVVLRANQSRLDYGPLKDIFRVPEAENPTAAGIARFKDKGKEGQAARRAAQDALELKNKEFNGQGVEMNQRYISTAVIPDASLEPEEWDRDAELFLKPTSRPGAKVPHAWLVNHRGFRVSTLDVTGQGKMTLVTGLAGGAWVEAVNDLDLPYLSVVVTGEGEALDPYCEWQRRREVEEAGAVLVRPDGYVAWRMVEAVEDAATAKALLQSALNQSLSQAPATQRVLVEA